MDTPVRLQSAPPPHAPAPPPSEGPAPPQAESPAPQAEGRESPAPPRLRRADARARPDPHPPVPSALRIVVSGYPNYTQPQDLLEVFTKFGTVRIDKCNSWSATLTFASEQEALAAATANRRLHIYGHYLAVRLYSARAAADAQAPPAPPKRDFPMTKQKGLILEPKKIDLSGDFHSQLDNILSSVRLTQEDVKSLSQLYTDLEIALQSQWPGCKAVPFGSITTGLGIKTSDADCFINIPGQFRQLNGNYVNKAKRVLMQYGNTFAEILAIPRANTPIVKFFHIPTEINCDVTFKTPLGAQNSRLIAFLLHSDPRLLPMSVTIKYWAKVHDLSGTGKLTNYALTLMIIFYLQQPPHSILPNVAWLQQDVANAYIVDHWNTGFMNNPALLPPSSNTSSISELLGGFFEYYSLFNFDEMVICPYLGVPVKRTVFSDTPKMPADFERYKKNVLGFIVMPLRYQTTFVVQDPFEQCHNVASTITTKLGADIRAYFRFCANSYEKEKLNSCQDFFKTILLQRPKLIRGKQHPEFRVNLFPRIVNTIISFDWKSVVKDLVMEIFENMLKIKLGKVEEKVNPDTKKEKEKYSGTLTKPIWKRKSFSKLYSVMDMSFEEKQGRITQEIMNAERQELNIQFQLNLTFCHDPKSAVVSTRLASGDLEAFREFGKFFISVTQNWLTELLKPYSMPSCKDTATKIAETMEDKNEKPIDSDDDDSEIILVPKSELDAETPTSDNMEQTLTNTEETPTNKTDDTSANSTGETSQSSPIKTLTDKTNELLTISEGNLNKTAGIVTSHTDEILAKTAEILTNDADDTITRKIDISTNSAIETSSNNADTLSRSVENFFKNAESLLQSATNTDTPLASASDVTCTLK